MPINAQFNYRGQPWAPYLSITLQLCAAATMVLSYPSDWKIWGAMALAMSGIAVMWYRADQGMKAMQYQLEAFMSVNIGRALVESNVTMLKRKDPMPSQILQEAISGVQEES